MDRIAIVLIILCLITPNQLSAMETSNKGLTFIAEVEGLRLQTYQDLAGNWTVGYGHRIEGPYMATKSITIEEAQEFLKEDTRIVEKSINSLVSSPLNQNQFDALVSLTFNIGTWAFQESTLLIELNYGNYELAALEFPKWSYVKRKFSAGLFKRRLKEAALFVN